MGNPWNGTYVFSSGNLKLDLLHNFFLECGARANKIRVYEMVDDPVAREMVGYLLVRGGTHIVAYAKALEALSGVDVGKLLPIPDISNKRFPEAKKHEAKGLHQVMYRMSPDDYREMSAHLARAASRGWFRTSSRRWPSRRRAGPPASGGATADVANRAGWLGPGMLGDIAKRLFG